MKKAKIYEEIQFTLCSIIYITIICQIFSIIVYLTLTGIFLYLLAIKHLVAMGILIAVPVATFLLPKLAFLFLITITSLIETNKILIFTLKSATLMFFFGIQNTPIRLKDNDNTNIEENKPKNK